LCFWEGFGERGPNFKWESLCCIRIYEAENQAVVVATDIDDPQTYPAGTGTSITNCAENLALMICETFGIAPEKVVWVKITRVKPPIRPTCRPSNSASCGLRVFGQPRWKYLPQEDAVTLTGDENL
jgi:hypothetical protein